MQFTGCGTALVTPFHPDFSLDEAALRKLLQRQIRGGVDFLVPCGTTGENPTLTRREHLRVVEITLQEGAEKIPILAGAGAMGSSLPWPGSRAERCRRGRTGRSRVPSLRSLSFFCCPAFIDRAPRAS